MHGKIAGNIKKKKKKERSENNGHDEENALPRTSVVLLLLVVIAEFPFTLCRHPTLRLHHLLYFIGTTLESLRRVEALGVGVGAGAIELADRVVTRSHGAGNASICEV